MSDREELQALRRLAELEAKAGNIPNQDYPANGTVTGGRTNATVRPASPQSGQTGDMGTLGAVVQGFNQGVPFGNRITASLAAGAVAPFVDETYSELYDAARQSQATTSELNPNAETAGLVGSIASTLPLAFSKATATTPILGDIANAAQKATAGVGNFIKGSPLPATGALSAIGNAGARAGRASIPGAASGFIYGYGAGDEGQRLDNALESAGVGGISGAALPLIGSAIGGAANAASKGTKNIITGIGARTGEELSEAAKALKNDAVSVKKAADLSNIQLTPDETSSLINNIDAALANTKLIPEFTPKTIGAIRTLKEDAAKGNLTLNDIDQYRRLLGSANSEDAVAASSVRRALDSTVNSLSSSGRTKESIDLLNQFRKDFSQASKFEDISDILIRADGDPNKIKSGLTRFMNNENNLRGFSDAEKKALKMAASSSAPEKVLKMLGKFGLDLGTSTGVGNTVAPLVGALGTGAAYGTGAGAIVPVAGTVARQGQKYLARGKAEELLRVIEGGGKVSAKQIKELPKEDQRQILDAVLRISNPSQAEEIEAIYKGVKRK